MLTINLNRLFAPFCGLPFWAHTTSEGTFVARDGSVQRFAPPMEHFDLWVFTLTLPLPPKKEEPQ